MATTAPKRQRKGFNRVIQTLSELYGVPYFEVKNIYVRQERSIENTKMILNLKSINHE